MAIYKIASLNYMTAGSNRVFVNMDTVRGYELYKPVVLLRNEEPYISAAAVSKYAQYQNVQADWSGISGYLEPIGTLDYIGSRWAQLSDAVSAAILGGMTADMTSTPLSVLCSDIVTEQREGDWLKTEYLTKEFASGAYDMRAMAALSSSEAVLLHERQRYWEEAEDGHRMYVRLCPPGAERATIERIDAFNRAARHVNRTFVLDTDLASRSDASRGGERDVVDSGLNVMYVPSADEMYPMYDMVDVHVKSADKNKRSSLLAFDAAVTGKREDIYLPQLTADPIGYCQVAGDSYMLTEATRLAPGMLQSSLAESRGSAGSVYTVRIDSEPTKTYLYGMAGSHADVEGLPRSNLAGVEYNNVTQFPMSDIRAGYSEGNEYGYMIRGKNALDSLYNMQLRVSGSNVSAYGCRDYAGVGQFSGSQLYFKFFDGVVYSGVQAGSEASMQRKDGGQKVPYQKIECAYVNRFTSANVHKSRFYSIRMTDTRLNQYQGIPDEQLSGGELEKKKLYDKIMLDIGAAVREIAENLQPSHTQLFRVIFDG